MIPLMSSANAQGHPGIVRSCAIVQREIKKNLMSKNPNPTEIPRFRISAKRQTKTKLRGVETGLEEFFSKWCHVPGHETSEIRRDYSKSDVNVRNRT